MKNIIKSLIVITAMVALAIGSTGAFFSDKETSVNNTFTAGAIDLKLDNECHYNGRVCKELIEGEGTYVWYDADGLPTEDSCTCSWKVADWVDGTALFNFLDIKPGDEGEDTISLHIDSNPAWVCAEVVNVVNQDNGCNEPELIAEGLAYGVGSETCGNPGVDEGELWSNLIFDIWMDTGAGDHTCNNIYDADETYLIQDATAVDLQYAIVDSQTGGEPITDACIGISWHVPFSVNNIAQTDSVTGDIVFKAYQARHNDDFVCFPSEDPVCDNGTVETGETCELPDTQNNSFCDQSSSQCADTKTMTRDSFGNCDVSCGCIEDPWSDPVCVAGKCGATCAVDADCDDGNANTVDTCLDDCGCDNTDITGTLTVIKVVENPGDLADVKVAGDFQMTIDGSNAEQGQAYPVVIGAHTVSEVNDFGYIAGYSANCPGGVATVAEDEDVVCTVTNTVPYFSITVTKLVNNTQWNGNNSVSDFPLFVGGQRVTSGITKMFAPGSYLVSESSVNGYYGTYAGDCNSATHLITGANRDAKVCTLTNLALAAQITLIKNVVDGTAAPEDFIMRVDGRPIDNGGSTLVTANTPHTITEDTKSDYVGTISGNAKCPSVLGGTSTLNEGEHITCTITNTYTL